MRDDGFTIAELLAALLVLSLGMMFLGEAIFQQGRTWSRLGTTVDQISTLATLYPAALSGEGVVKSHAPLGDGPVLAVEDGPPLALSAARIDRTAECRFDPIGRRCL